MIQAKQGLRLTVMSVFGGLCNTIEAIFTYPPPSEY